MAVRPTQTIISHANINSSFYANIRPFGAWGPIRRKSRLSAEGPDEQSESVLLAAVNVILGSSVVLGAYLFPMYLVGHWHVRAMLCLGLALAAGVLLYFTWYRNLPEP